jgi:ketosteroid isomerase-like protein
VSSREEVLAAADRLSGAFAARSLPDAMACFAPDESIVYVGSEAGEEARGRGAVAALLRGVFARPEAYSWRVCNAIVYLHGDVAMLYADAVGHMVTDRGHEQAFSYRLSGLLEHSRSGWLWRLCHGCEPCPR